MLSIQTKKRNTFKELSSKYNLYFLSNQNIVLISIFLISILIKSAPLGHRYTLMFCNGPCLYIFKLLKKYQVLAGDAQQTEHRPANQSVASLILSRAHSWVAGYVPSRGCTRGNHTLKFHSPSSYHPHPLSLKIKS